MLNKLIKDILKVTLLIIVGMFSLFSIVMTNELLQKLYSYTIS